MDGHPDDHYQLDGSLMAVIPIAGFLPDVDPTTPGVWTTCDGYVPTLVGMRSAYEPVNVGYSPLAKACLGAVLARLVDDSTRIIAGTDDNLWEVAAGDWVERSSTSDAYETGNGRWRFTQVGNVTLATNGADRIQKSILSGTFSDLANSPIAKFICTTKSSAGEFVVLGSTNDSGLSIGGSSPNSEDANRVWWSGLGNYTTWQPSLASEAGTLQLVDTPGPLTGLKTLGDYVIAYKARSIYLGTYQGNQIQWGFRSLPGDIGASSNESIVSIGSAHLFLGAENFYKFSGDIPQPIGDGIKKWFFTELDVDYAGNIVSLYDRYADICYWFYPSRNTGGGVLDRWVAYHVSSGRWGAGSNNVEAALETVSASPTWNELWAGLTFDTIPDVDYDSKYFAVGKAYPTVFTTAHVMSGLSGAGGTNSFTTGYVGDDQKILHLRRITPRWKQLPSSATAVHRHGNTLGGTITTKTATTMSNGRFDLRQAARWHQLTVGTSGTCELSGIGYDLVPAGRE
jgi:hypothetical protein